MPITNRCKSLIVANQVYNYDYVIDTNFYVDGTIEPRLQTSG
jgi:Cu2+-containing amine oxidase